MELKEETARALAERAAVLVEERTRRPYLEIRPEDADVPAGISKIGGAAMRVWHGSPSPVNSTERGLAGNAHECLHMQG